MLTEKTISVLAKLEYQPHAVWEVNLLPFGSIFWKDEMPAIIDLFDKPEDRSVIHAMFGIRLKIWDDGVLRRGFSTECNRDLTFGDRILAGFNVHSEP